MRLRLLGTGSAAGWPNPWCACASCAAAVRQGVLRGQTSVLVDDRLLLDVGAEAPRAAVRAGVGLAGVEAVLVGHGHPDHHDPAAWRWRGWAGSRRPLHLVAPPAVVEAAQPWLDASVTVTTARAGDTLDVAGFTVRVLPAAHGRPQLGPAVLYDLTAPDGTRLMYACDTGPLPQAALDATLGRAYDAVLLELTGGTLPTHLDLRTWPEQVAALRRLGAVTPRTRLLAAHLGHDLPPPDELDRLLASWGAAAPRDGDVVEVGAAPLPPSAPRRVLVLGGARSGKSAHAEALLAAEPAVTYVATSPPRSGDEEWDARVAAHVERRPPHWTTLETGDVAGALRGTQAVLVDDLGLWLTRLLDDAAGWDDRAAATAAVDAALPPLLDAWRSAGRAVVVAPEVGGGLVAATLGGRLFVDLLGTVTAALARDADEVVQVVAGLPRRLR